MEITDPMTQLDDSSNLEKYKIGGEVVATVLDKLIDECKPGKSIYELCILGDDLIKKELNNVYQKISIKGLAFPTCVSINNIAGYNSPQKEDGVKIKEGDLVKIELGVHIDGFPALIAYTVYVEYMEDKNKKNKDDEKILRLLKAISEASKEVVELMKPGKKNTEIVNTLQKYAKKYECNLPLINENIHAPGILSYQMSRGVISGYNDGEIEHIHRFLLHRNNEEYDFSMREIELERDEVYCIDIVMSTGTGKLTRDAIEPMIFKRLQDEHISLKLKSSRTSLSSFKKNRFPENVRDRYDVRFKLGLKECLEKKIVEPYYIMKEKNKEFVARAQFTVIVRNNTILICARSLDEQIKKLEKKITK